METLRELTNDMYALLEYADSTDPDDQQVFQDTLDGLIAVIEKKADSYCTVMDQIKANIALHDMEIQRLTDRKRAMARNIQRMQDALLAAMVAMDEKKIRTDHYTITRCKDGGKQPMSVDEENVPDEFKVEQITYKTDKDKIRAALEAGEELPFAQLRERGEHIMVK